MELFGIKKILHFTVSGKLKPIRLNSDLKI